MMADYVLDHVSHASLGITADAALAAALACPKLANPYKGVTEVEPNPPAFHLIPTTLHIESDRATP